MKLKQSKIICSCASDVCGVSDSSLHSDEKWNHFGPLANFLSFESSFPVPVSSWREKGWKKCHIQNKWCLWSPVLGRGTAQWTDQNVQDPSSCNPCICHLLHKTYSKDFRSWFDLCNACPCLSKSKETNNHQSPTVREFEILNLIRLFWGRVFPYMGRIHTAYLGQYLHCRYLKYPEMSK